MARLPRSISAAPCNCRLPIAYWGPPDPDCMVGRRGARDSVQRWPVPWVSRERWCSRLDLSRVSTRNRPTIGAGPRAAPHVCRSRRRRRHSAGEPSQKRGGALACPPLQARAERFGDFHVRPLSWRRLLWSCALFKVSSQMGWSETAGSLSCRRFTVLAAVFCGLLYGFHPIRDPAGVVSAGVFLSWPPPLSFSRSCGTAPNHSDRTVFAAVQIESAKDHSGAS